MKLFSALLTFLGQNTPKIHYRLLSVEKDEHEDYLATVQVINKKAVFKIKPEEILGNDQLTDSFSARDIRALTYLGYLGINAPKYKILAQRLSEQDQTLFFAIQEKGKKHPIVKTANEISADTALLKSLDQQDAHRVGFIAATEQAEVEKKMRARLISEKS
jgi:hypothetical protein